MSEASDNPGAWQNPNFVDSPASDRAANSLLLGNGLRSRVKQGWAIGTFVIELPDSTTLEVLALAGFDFVVLDMEHSSISFDRLQHLLRAGHAAGLAMLVRVWGKDSGLIGKVLDMGAHGIMAPHVDTAARALEVVNEARFPPRGRRGFSPITRFDALREPLEAMDRSTYVVVQIEGRKALERVDEIAAVPGIDSVFIGPYDLALSLGVSPGSEPVFDAAEKMARSVPQHVGLGIYVDDPAHCGRWVNSGFALQCVSFDSRMLSSGARAVMDAARQGVALERSAQSHDD